MSKKIGKYILLALFFFILTIFFLALKNDPRYISNDLIGKKIQNFKYKKFNGNNEILSQNDINKTTLINFWASWCYPCRLEHKYLIKLKSNTNIKIIGINYKDDQENAQSFLQEFLNPYDLIGVDNDGVESVKFGIFGIPETFIVNGDKIILKKFIGPLNQKNYQEIINIINK